MKRLSKEDIGLAGVTLFAIGLAGFVLSMNGQFNMKVTLVIALAGAVLLVIGGNRNEME